MISKDIAPFRAKEFTRSGGRGILRLLLALACLAAALAQWR
jgi:hypothetical protein